MKQLLAITLAGIALLVGYPLYRQTAISRLEGELVTQRETIARQQSLEQEAARQSRQLAAGVDLASFVEALHACARQAGIDDHEVTTGPRQEQAQIRRPRRTPGQGEGVELKTSRLQVVLRSDYRGIAEYLRQIDGLGRPTQITRLEMTAEGSLIRLLLLIDLYSLKRPDTHAR